MNMSAAPQPVLPLWRRLATLQPSFFGGRLRQPPPHTPESRAGGGGGAAPFTFSCVVVPPPVPGAVPAFHAHMCTLLRGLHPEFVTITSYTPYFSTAAEEERAALDMGGGGGGRGLSCGYDAATAAAAVHEPSATQYAVRYTLDEGRSRGVPVVLTVTATRATHAGACGGGPMDSLVGATRSGIAAVVHDFYHDLLMRQGDRGLASHTGSTRGSGAGPAPVDAVVGGGLMVLRGDDHGYTRQTWRTALDPGRMTNVDTHAGGPAPVPEPYRGFPDGTALLRFCGEVTAALDNVHHTPSHKSTRGERAPAPAEEDRPARDGGVGDARARLSLFTGGYPQGHCLEKYWDCPPTDAALPSAPDNYGGTEDGSTAARPPHHPAAEAEARRRSLDFLDRIDAVLAETNVPRPPRGLPPTAEGAGVVDAAGSSEASSLSLAAVRESMAAAVAAGERIQRRAREGALALCDVSCAYSTPSARAEAAAEAEAAAYRARIREGLVRPRLVPARADAQTGVASVVVTQMITSADEFLRYADVVYDEVARAHAEQRSVADSDGPEAHTHEPVVVVIPGLLAPLPAEDYMRTVLQMKVVPSPTVALSLRRYVQGLEAALEQLRGDATLAEGTADELLDRIRQFEIAKATLASTFQSEMEEDAFAMCCALREAGYRHVNWSCFSYGCGPAVARVAARMRGDEVGGGK